MIHTSVDKIPFMGDEDEAFLVGEIFRNFIPCRGVQMAGRLIDQEKGVFFEEERGQQYLRLLSETE